MSMSSAHPIQFHVDGEPREGSTTIRLQTRQGVYRRRKALIRRCFLQWPEEQLHFTFVTCQALEIFI